MSTCYAMAVMIQLAFMAGAFVLGLRCRHRWNADRLVERNKWATFAGGATLSLLFLVAPALWGLTGLPESRGLSAISLFIAFVAPVFCPWWVYRATEDRG